MGRYREVKAMSPIPDKSLLYVACSGRPTLEGDAVEDITKAISDAGMIDYDSFKYVLELEVKVVAIHWMGSGYVGKGAPTSPYKKDRKRD